MITFLKTYERRVSLLICLFIFPCFALLQATPDRTLAGYAARLLWSNPFERCPGPAVSDDSGPQTTITGAGGYDLMYKETVADSQHIKLKNSRTNAFDGTLLIRTSQNGWGLQGGWDCSRLNSSWTGEDYIFEENSILSFNRILLGGWWSRGHAALNCQVGVDPGYCIRANLDHTLYREKLASIWNSPGLDLTAALTLNYPEIWIDYYYRNSAPFAGYNTIANNSNSAQRRLPLVVDENRFGIAFGYSGSVVAVNLDGAFNLLGGAVDTGVSYDLPLSVNGCGGSARAAIDAKRLPYKPHLRFSGDYARIDAGGFDISGERFLRVEGTSFFSIEGAVELYPGNHSMFGPLFSFVRVKAGDGMVALYPFSNWLYVLDLPDRYKIYAMMLFVTEGGLCGNREWELLRNHSLKTNIALTGCRIYGSIETAEQVRYMGILPVYENHATEIFVDSKYAVIKAALNYTYTLKTHEMFIAFQQILPIEISGSGNNSGSRTGVNKRRLYGGMRVEGGVVLKL